MQARVDLKTNQISTSHHWFDIVAGVWILLALISLVPLASLFDTALPAFIIVWLVVPLFSWIKTRCASRIGMRIIHWKLFAACGAQALAALFLPPLQGALYIFVYSWLAIGVINGWSAWRTNSVWPGLVSAAIINSIMTALLY